LTRSPLSYPGQNMVYPNQNILWTLLWIQDSCTCYNQDSVHVKEWQPGSWLWQVEPLSQRSEILYIVTWCLEPHPIGFLACNCFPYRQRLFHNHTLYNKLFLSCIKTKFDSYVSVIFLCFCFVFKRATFTELACFCTHITTYEQANRCRNKWRLCSNHCFPHNTIM